MSAACRCRQKVNDSILLQCLCKLGKPAVLLRQNNIKLIFLRKIFCNFPICNPAVILPDSLTHRHFNPIPHNNPPCCAFCGTNKNEKCCLGMIQPISKMLSIIFRICSNSCFLSALPAQSSFPSMPSSALDTRSRSFCKNSRNTLSLSSASLLP